MENWMWPRHTGDFSMFRIYAGADNKPTDYSKDNKPYRADQFFKINGAGYKEGDFTMVYGFPGTTAEYISSYELKEVYNISDPISIAARTRKLDVWTKHMALSRDIFGDLRGCGLHRRSRSGGIVQMRAPHRLQALDQVRGEGVQAEGGGSHHGSS